MISPLWVRKRWMEVLLLVVGIRVPSLLLRRVELDLTRRDERIFKRRRMI